MYREFIEERQARRRGLGMHSFCALVLGMGQLFFERLESLSWVAHGRVEDVMAHAEALLPGRVRKLFSCDDGVVGRSAECKLEDTCLAIASMIARSGMR